MSAYGRNRGRRPIGYFAEFIIIIAGVSVSFFLNEWRESNKAEQKKINLLHEVSSDLKKDSVLLSFSQGVYRRLLASHDSLLLDRKDILPTDSLDIYVDQVVSYYPFKEAESTFIKISNDPNLTINEEDTLLEHFLTIHNQFYNMIHEWDYIEKEFVLNQMIPYMDQHAPFLYPTPEGKSFQGKVFYSLKNEDAFMNLLKSGRNYKFAVLQINISILNHINGFKRQVDNYLAQLEE